MAGQTGATAELLLVEDNPGDVRFIEEAVAGSELDVTVHAVTTRAAALEFLQRQGDFEAVSTPDAVLLDWHLSAGTADEVLAAAKAADPSPPVVVMTGSRAELPSVEADHPDADRIVRKQTDPEGYVEIIRSVLAGQ